MQSGLSVVTFTEHLSIFCASGFIAVYEEYSLWHVPLEIISLARDFGTEIEVVLGSRWNVDELLE